MAAIAKGVATPAAIPAIPLKLGDLSSLQTSGTGVGG